MSSMGILVDFYAHSPLLLFKLNIAQLSFWN
nr:MAG TPA: hypothetical protein [Caudoviricetes sp.]